MTIKATDFMAAMGVEVYHISEKGVERVLPKMTEEEAVKKLYEVD